MLIGAEERLRKLSIALPEFIAAGGNYISAKTVRNVVVYIAGVISTDAGKVITGTVGLDRNRKSRQ